MREGGKRLRRLGFAALFMFAASAAAAQTQQFSTGQRNLACGSPASLDDGWPIATPESVGLDGAAPVRHRGAARGHQRQRSCRGDRPPRQARFRAILPRLRRTLGHGRGATARIRRHDQARHALGFEERDLPAGWNRDRSRTDQERRRTRRQILSGLFAAENGGLGQHHPPPSADDVVGHSVGRKSRLEGSAERRTASRQRGRSVPLCPVEADRGTSGHRVELQWRRNGPARQHHRARIGQVAGGVRARGAVHAAWHLGLGMDEVPE